MKNEADFIPYWLDKLSKQVDYFMFRDNGSTDGTYELLKNHPKTIYCDQTDEPFYIGMWNKLFREVNKNFSENDWVLMAASDILPLFNLIEKIELADSKKCNCIRKFAPTFFFTREMFSKYKKNNKYKKKINNFDINNYKYFINTSNSFPSIIKNLKGIKVDRNMDNPKIPNKKIYHDSTNPAVMGHYKFRNPKQIKVKLLTRRNARINGTKTFRHYRNIWDFRKYLISEKLLYEYTGNFKGKLKRKELINLIRDNNKHLRKKK